VECLSPNQILTKYPEKGEDSDSAQFQYEGAAQKQKQAIFIVICFALNQYPDSVKVALVVVLRNTWFENLKKTNKKAKCSEPISITIQFLLHIFVDRFAGLGLGVLGQLTWQHQFAGALNGSRIHRRLLIVFDDVAGLDGDAIKGIVDEAIHHVHRSFRHSDLWMNLLQHLEDVQVERLSPLLLVWSGTSAALWGSGRHCDNRDAANTNTNTSANAIELLLASFFSLCTSNTA